ncbi:MAG: hypothetical protein PVF49_11645, partial [Anaerolineales bacterium]
MPAADPYSYANLEEAQIKHISLKLSLDFNTRKISALVEYQLDRPLDGDFCLDTHSLDIESIQRDGQNLDWQLAEEHDQL